MNKVEQRIKDKKLDLVALNKQAELLGNYCQRQSKQNIDPLEREHLKKSTQNQIKAIQSEIMKLSDQAVQIEKQDSSIAIDQNKINHEVDSGTKERDKR